MNSKPSQSKPSTIKDTKKPHKKKADSDIIAKLEADLSVAKAEGNSQAALSITKILKYFTSKK